MTELQLKVHMDGARLFNAAAALGVPVAQITQHVDSVTFCLSKVFIVNTMLHYVAKACVVMCWHL